MEPFYATALPSCALFTACLERAATPPLPVRVTVPSHPMGRHPGQGKKRAAAEAAPEEQPVPSGEPQVRVGVAPRPWDVSESAAAARA